jgi:hypothetical protein
MQRDLGVRQRLPEAVARLAAATWRPVLCGDVGGCVGERWGARAGLRAAARRTWAGDWRRLAPSSATLSRRLNLLARCPLPLSGRAAAGAACRCAQAVSMPVGADHEGQRQAFTRAQRTKNAGDTLLSQRSFVTCCPATGAFSAV